MKVFRKRLNIINAFLITLIFHLIILIILLSVKLQKLKHKQNNNILIELIEEDKELPKNEEEKIEMEKFTLSEMRNLADNISNVARSKEIEKLKNNISTELYEQQVMKELGIKSLKNDFKDLEKDYNSEEIINNSKEDKKDNILQNTQSNKKTTITYSLEGRYLRHQYVPVYLCKGGGLVTINIVVDRWGKVINAEYSKEKSQTIDPCLIEEAIKSSYRFLFNSDQKAPEKQSGYISFLFINQ